jgi:hypothetical protein
LLIVVTPAVLASQNVIAVALLDESLDMSVLVMVASATVDVLTKSVGAPL